MINQPRGAGPSLRLLLGAAVLGLLLPVSPQAATTAPKPGRAAHVVWAEDTPWPAVLEVAAAASPPRPVLIDFYAQWCGPCKLMDGFVYNEPEVIAELGDVVTFKVDIDKPEYAELRQRFNITLLPTLVWCDERGREMDRFTGAVSAREFLQIVRTFRSGENSFLRIGELAAARPEDPGLLFDLARRHAEQGDLQRARVLYHRLMNLRLRTDSRVVVDGMLGLAALEQAAGNPARAGDIARRSALAVGPQETGAVESLMAVAAFQGALGDTSGMLATYGLLIARDDSDPVALEAYARVATAAGIDLPQAARYALRGVVMSGDDPRVMATLARCYFRQEEYLKAVRWMEKAAAGAPDNEQYRQLAREYREALESRPYLFRGRRR